MDITSLLNTASNKTGVGENRNDEKQDGYDKLFSEYHAVDDAAERAADAAKANQTGTARLDGANGVKAELSEDIDLDAVSDDGLSIFSQASDEPTVVDSSTVSNYVESRVSDGAARVVDSGQSGRIPLERPATSTSDTPKTPVDSLQGNAKGNQQPQAAQTKTPETPQPATQRLGAQVEQVASTAQGMLSKPTTSLTPGALNAALSAGTGGEGNLTQGAVTGNGSGFLGGDTTGQNFAGQNPNAFGQLAGQRAGTAQTQQAQVQAAAARATVQAPAPTQPTAPVLPTDNGLPLPNQQSQQAQQTRAPAQPPTPNQARASTHSQALADQVAVQIQRAVRQGVDRINIQLKPAEMGRVEVTMEVTTDGRMQAVVRAENPDTLNLLMQRSDDLRMALQSQGLELDSNQLGFALHGEEQHYTADGQEMTAFADAADVDTSEEEAAEIVTMKEWFDGESVNLTV